MSNKEKQDNVREMETCIEKTSMMSNLVIYTFKVAAARNSLCSETINITWRENDTHTYSCLPVLASRSEQSSHRTQINGIDRVFVALKHTLPYRCRSSIPEQDSAVSGT